MTRRLVAGVLALASLTFPTAPAQAAPHKACEYEDSTGCVWDARHMGNGEGRSFIRKADGSTVYITHKRAHRLIYGGK